MPDSDGPPATGGWSKGLIRALSLLDRVTEQIEKLILGCTVLFISGMLVVHVLARQLLSSGVTGQVELTQMCIVIMTFAGLGYGVRRARHICMSAFYDQLKGWPRKTLLITICLLTGALMFYFCWHAYEYVSAIQSRGRKSSALQIPLWIPYLIVPIGFALAGIQYWLTALRNMTSADIYRSFSEKERYDDVPDDLTT
ncbi:TRAP transporter small permease [Halopseudomonas laoshanensis]|uniref:TRAP transporter small permease protein n=1 Tax=Halopseudomonas laoshanensis TaxID=2268758 RepID=A0A7V7GWF2_9GAMM|nr:TRAP transporter small permease [Halopseudomonas laoshanensis]KAA0696244.1 TRAP transporter small permease [Halopseudomonas laoshanensis]WOD09951.1 TRAP transporter small permease [Pseudomonas sp. NyZ704]